jgi:hypothetical protein
MKCGNRLRWGVAACLVGLAGLTGSIAWGGPGEDKAALEKQKAKDIELLKGVPGVWVLVEWNGDDPKGPAVDGKRLQTAVELQLRKAGIKVLTRQEWDKLESSPRLYFAVNLHTGRGSPSSDLIPFSLKLQYEEWVTVSREKPLSRMATLWESSGGGVVVSRSMLPKLVDNAMEMIDEFANLYLAANPRKTD